MNANSTLDLKGLKCPMPIVKLSQSIKTLITTNQILEVIADDPAFDPDVKAWCNKIGHELLSIENNDNIIKAYIKKK